MSARTRTHCPNCGAQYQPYARTCHICGRVRDQKSDAELVGPAATQAQTGRPGMSPEQQASYNRKVFTGVGVVVGGALLYFIPLLAITSLAAFAVWYVLVAMPKRRRVPGLAWGGVAVALMGGCNGLVSATRPGAPAHPPVAARPAVAPTTAGTPPPSISAEVRRLEEEEKRANAQRNRELREAQQREDAQAAADLESLRAQTWAADAGARAAEQPAPPTPSRLPGEYVGGDGLSGYRAGSGSGSGGHYRKGSGPKTVSVRSYVKKDGTFVRGHNRSKASH